MHNPVCAFEIAVSDLDRAIAFYSAVFDYAFEREWVDGNEFAWFPFEPEAPGIGGALAKGESYTPGTLGVRLYFRTPDLEATLARAVAAGGQVLYPPTAVGELGWVAEFEDSEGNCIGLHAQRT
jgi:predicted enzyme related to lactoylglutathione lyase